MTRDDEGDGHAARSEPPAGLPRRGLLRTGAGLGVAGLVGGLTAPGAAAAHAAPERAPVGSEADDAVPTGEPLVAHLRDVRSGELDVFVGDRHVRITDHQLATRLARTAR